MLLIQTYCGLKPHTCKCMTQFSHRVSSNIIGGEPGPKLIKAFTVHSCCFMHHMFFFTTSLLSDRDITSQRALSRVSCPWPDCPLHLSPGDSHVGQFVRDRSGYLDEMSHNKENQNEVYMHKYDTAARIWGFTISLLPKLNLPKSHHCFLLSLCILWRSHRDTFVL